MSTSAYLTAAATTQPALKQETIEEKERDKVNQRRLSFLEKYLFIRRWLGKGSKFQRMTKKGQILAVN